MLSIQELRSSTLKELLQEHNTTQKDLVETTIRLRSKHEKDSSSKGKKRRYLALVKTIIKEVELDEVIKNADKIDS
jgi:ribosomal protein L29